MLFEIIEENSYDPYNIVCDHSVYSDEYPFSYMPKDTVSIALIREPFSRFKSAFRYFNIARQFNLTDSKYPMYEFMKLVAQSKLGQHIQRMVQNTQLKTFGTDTVDTMNVQEVDSYIKHLDEKFKLVFTLAKIHGDLSVFKTQF